MSSYRIHCLWRPDGGRAGCHAFGASRGAASLSKRGGIGQPHQTPKDALIRDVLERQGDFGAAMRLGDMAEIREEEELPAPPPAKAPPRQEGFRVIAGLTLYKVRPWGGL